MISPDLTRNDPRTLGDSGGPITKDQNGPEIYGTIFTIAPSRRDVNTIWTGSDDGLVYVTSDGGKHWSNVTPPGMGEFNRVSLIEASPTDPATAYVAAKRYQMDDRRPYLFKTHDYGKTWSKIVENIPANDFVQAVREDPERAGLLYAGTEHGIYISFDDGAHWRSLALNLPDTQIADIAVEKERPGDRDAWQVVLYSGRHRDTAPVDARRHQRSDASVRTASGDSSDEARGDRLLPFKRWKSEHRNFRCQGAIDSFVRQGTGEGRFEPVRMGPALSGRDHISGNRAALRDAGRRSGCASRGIFGSPDGERRDRDEDGW